MTIKQFVEKAIEGGFEERMWGMGNCSQCSDIFLDPKAWEAVSKVEGWGGAKNLDTDEYTPYWQNRMRGMIDALIEGKTIEEFLKTL